MTAESHQDPLSLLASAVAGRPIMVAPLHNSDAAWTDGQAIYIDREAPRAQQLQTLCVQCALLASGSLDRAIMQQLARRPATARRYLTIEGWRALTALRALLPPALHPLLAQAPQYHSTSPHTSLQLARSNSDIPAPPLAFGTLRIRQLLTAMPHPGGSAAEGLHIPPQQRSDKPKQELAEADSSDEEDQDDGSTSPVGGGGAIGKLLQRMFQMVRRVKGGDSPGADAASHYTRGGSRAGVHALQSTSEAETVEEAFGKGVGILYPEWDFHQQRYREDWCTVTEIDAPPETSASVQWLDGHALRKPLSRLGLGLERIHREPQGDDIDIDAAIDMRVAIRARVAAEQTVYIQSQRQRRDLSVMILLDISGSVTQAAVAGNSVHEQQRSVAAALTTVLYEVGDRLAVYAFHSQGRKAVHLMPVKRFDEVLDSRVMSRLHNLKPGAYSRLGAAMRHGTRVLAEQSGTERRLLVVLSDGLAYDHGYEPGYGAADARQALGEARADGIGCLCLSIGANTDSEVLRRVFGSAAHATVPTANELGPIIGPLFRAALRNAEIQRRAA